MEPRMIDKINEIHALTQKIKEDELKLRKLKDEVSQEITTIAVKAKIETKDFVNNLYKVKTGMGQ